MRIYLIPGLGFDQRMFEPLELQTFKFQYINWIEPINKESIKEYAQRLLAGLDDREENVIIGHSFGGMIAQEIAAIKKVKKIILISSIKARIELPYYFKIINPLKIYKVFNKALILKTVKFWGTYHDYRTPEEIDLFKNMVNCQSNAYLKWALKNLSQWTAPQIPEHTKIIQIHGAKDRTFPLSLIVKPDHIISGGGHFMVFKERAQLESIILRELKSRT